MADDAAQPFDRPLDIAPDAVFWRRVRPDWIIPDENLGRRRPSSAAFDDDRDGDPMSMYQANAGNAVEDVLQGFDGYGLVSLTGAQLKALGYAVFSRPEQGFPSHVEVSGKKTKGAKSNMAKNALWVFEP
jgi:hypothetical protein